MIRLDTVTLIAVATKDVEATGRALEYSCRGIEFAKVKLVSPYKPAGLADYVVWDYVAPFNTIDEWNRYILYDLPKHINTDRLLLCHADGHVVYPDMWRPEFLEYDYIGAPWPMPTDDFSYRDINGVIQRVGNSVSIRSKKLLDLANKLGLEFKAFHGFTNEDGFICVNYRHIYEAHGCKFAPLEVAKYFSHEFPIPEIEGIKPFAFHKWQGANKDYPCFL